jgi:hypothetical protein
MDTRNQIHVVDRNLAGPHLSDEQFTDLLLGTIPPSVTAHLEACPPCAQEATRVSGAIGSFEQHSRLWAERRASTHPALAPAPQPVITWLTRPAAWSAMAATLLLAAITGIGALHRTGHTVPFQQPAQQQVAAVQPAAQLSPATLQADNALLFAIDGELSADAAPPASLYGLKVGARAAHTRSLKKVSN